jgi:hypothetical protein
MGLCFFQSAFWQLMLQYQTVEHLEHFLEAGFPQIWHVVVFRAAGVADDMTNRYAALKSIVWGVLTMAYGMPSRGSIEGLEYEIPSFLRKVDERVRMNESGGRTDTLSRKDGYGTTVRYP